VFDLKRKKLFPKPLNIEFIKNSLIFGFSSLSKEEKEKKP
jgi:hypothetical protein